MVQPLQPPATATFDAAEPWRVNLGAAFADLVPGPWITRRLREDA
jgi:hypothetical protein